MFDLHNRPSLKPKQQQNTKNHTTTTHNKKISPTLKPSPTSESLIIGWLTLSLKNAQESCIAPKDCNGTEEKKSIQTILT